MISEKVLCSGCNVSLLGEEFLAHMEELHVGSSNFNTSIRIECGSCCFITTLQRIDAMVKHCLFEGHTMGRVSPETWKLIAAQEEARIAAIGKMTGVDKAVREKQHSTFQEPPETDEGISRAVEVHDNTGLEENNNFFDMEDNSSEREDLVEFNVANSVTEHPKSEEREYILEEAENIGIKTESIDLHKTVPLVKKPPRRRKKRVPSKNKLPRSERKESRECMLCRKKITGVASMRTSALSHALTHQRSLMPLSCANPSCQLRTANLKDLKKHCASARAAINGCQPKPLTETDDATRRKILHLAHETFPDLEWESSIRPGRRILYFRFSQS